MSTGHVIAVKYAKALFALAREKKLEDQVQHDLILVVRYFAQGDGQALLAHPTLPLAKKMEIIKDILGEQVSPLMFSFLKLLMEKGRGVLVGDILKVYESEWLAEQNRKLARVTTAIPLSAEQMKRLQKHLSELYEKEIELEQIVKPELQAGARIEIGDLVVDGTLRARMDRLRRAIRTDN
jgi:F-type H+-transporting ATPase subunit delta